MPNIADLPANMQAKIVDEGCWLWHGARGRDGYGYAWVSGRQRSAHRAAYEILVGPIPDGLQIDHLCRVTCCVNPDHLEPVTPRENVLRGNTPAAANAAKTHCPRGHEYDESWRRKSGDRRCLVCHREAETVRREQRKAVA